MQAVIEYYNGDVSAADNSGNYSVEKMITVDHEALGVMLMCTNGDFSSRLFKARAAWSVPGSHSAEYPCILLHLISIS